MRRYAAGRMLKGLFKGWTDHLFLRLNSLPQVHPSQQIPEGRVVVQSGQRVFPARRSVNNEL